jgi:hypothetical protein
VVVWAKVIILTKKNNSPFGRVKLFLPVRGKNLMTDTDDIIANKK